MLRTTRADHRICLRIRIKHDQRGYPPRQSGPSLSVRFHYYKEPLVVSHAKDQYVWDADGNQYLDFFGGIVTISVGHCNEEVNRKLHAQIDRLQHVSTVFANEPQAALAKKLAEITPGGKLTKSFSPTAAPKRTKPRFSPPAATPAQPKSWRCATPITAGRLWV